MSSIFSDGALHPGRDANDSQWLVLRTPAQWSGAIVDGVVLAGAVPPIMLRPASLSPAAPFLVEVVASDGTRFRSETSLDRVDRRRPCDVAWTPFVGPSGSHTGELRRPLGLALDERRGVLAICDADNHRVQIVRADGGGVVIVLANIDEPVSAAFSRGWLAIADRAGGRVHVYDDRFRRVASFAPKPPSVPAGFVPAPAYVAITGCIVWVIDAGWSIAIAYGLDGVVIHDAGDPPSEIADLLVHARFAAQGHVVVGPIDSKTEAIPWHRVIVDAHVPNGTAIEIQTYAAESNIAPAAIPWAPIRPVRIPLAEVESRDGEMMRPVLSDVGRWERKRGEPYHRRTAPIVEWAGDGPTTAGFALAWERARLLRTGDTVELVTAGQPVERLPIAGIGARPIRVVVRGDLQMFGAGAEVALLARDDEAPLGTGHVIAELAAGESVNLTSTADDGTIYDVPAAHAVAALLRTGDTVRLTVGLASAILIVHGIADADAAIVLAAAPVASYATGRMDLVVAPGRLVVDGLAWSEPTPIGEEILVAGAAGPSTIRWVERDLGVIWLSPGVVVPWETWGTFATETPVATDRGRYLWIRMCLLGAVEHPGDALATATPIIRSVRVLMPRPSYLRYLPAVYARRDEDDPSGALFLERLLALPEHRLTSIEARYEEVSRELNPLAGSDDWLTFVATWFGLVFDPSWPIERRRMLLVNAHDLFAKRGTVAGMRRYLEIYTGMTPAIIEGFQYRSTSAPPILGSPMTLGRTPLGQAPVDTGDSLAHWFSIWVFGDDAGCSSDVLDKAARAIIDSVKPAHTTYELRVISEPPRIGISTQVGVDTVLVGGERPPPPIGLTPRTPHVLGRTPLPLPRHASSTTTLGPLSIDDITLT